jgi:hypothetical protein
VVDSADDPDREQRVRPAEEDVDEVVLRGVDEGERHRGRIEREQRSAPARRAPEEERDQQRVGGVQRGHGRDGVRVFPAALEQTLERERQEGDVRGDRPDQAGRVLEVARAAREPRRRCGEERERDVGHAGEERDAADVAAEAVAREEPEQRCDEVRGHEVAHVDRPGGVVVPAHVRGVPEPFLQPDGGNGAAEEERVGLDLRPVPRGEEEAVGVPAEDVVDREHERERQPLEDDAAEPAADVRGREREQAEDDPEQQPLPSDRHAVPPHVRAQRGGVERRRDPAQRPGRSRKMHVHDPEANAAARAAESGAPGGGSPSPLPPSWPKRERPH